jgi:hypothetical protein
MSKQTAVEWFYWQIMYADVDVKVWKETLDQALAKERQQIIDAVDGFPIEHRGLDGDQYYTETYRNI